MTVVNKSDNAFINSKKIANLFSSFYRKNLKKTSHQGFLMWPLKAILAIKEKELVNERKKQAAFNIFGAYFL